MPGLGKNQSSRRKGRKERRVERVCVRERERDNEKSGYERAKAPADTRWMDGQMVG